MKLIVLIPVAGVLAFAQTGTIAPNGAPASFDCAADGSVMDSLSGQPIARARVNLISGGTSYTASTDAAGKWALNGIACAQAQLQVSRVGFLQTAAGSPPRAALLLVSGSPARNLETKLTPQSVALGKVIDDQGDPVMGAQVTVHGMRVIDGRRRFQNAGVASTNDLGEYRIPSLGGGKYVVCVHVNTPNNGLQSASQTIPADSCYPGPLEGGAASAMDLQAGREARVDFTLSQSIAVHVRGTVTGLPEGKNAGVNLIRRTANSDTSVTQAGGGTARNGTFDFRATPGSYMLTSDYFEAGKRLLARVPIEVGTSDIDNVNVHLESGFTVQGLVRFESQSGPVSPAPQFGVNLRSSELSNLTGQVKWDADRTAFSITDMVAGNYRLDVFPPGQFYTQSVTAAGQDMLNSEIPISQGAGPIEIVLRDDSGSVEGDVVDAGGYSVPAHVMLIRNGSHTAIMANQPGGHFKLQKLAPGDYTLYAWNDPTNIPYAEDEWMQRYATGGTAVTVTAGQTTQLMLTQQAAPTQ